MESKVTLSDGESFALESQIPPSHLNYLSNSNASTKQCLLSFSTQLLMTMTNYN